MKQCQINKAYPALMGLCKFKLPIKKAREIYLLSSNVKTHFEFAISEERKAINDYHGTENHDGTVSFNDQESFNSYKVRINELSDSEVDPDWTVVSLSDDDIGGQTISPSDIMNLEGFVTFE